MGGLRFGFMSMFMRLMAVARYRFIVELTVLFILVWTACAVLIERKVKEEMGLKMHKLSQHIVLIGWNLKGQQIIRTLRSNPMLADTPTVVVADLEHKPVDDPLVLFTRAPYPVRGDAIERCCLAQAATVVVLANYNEKHHADALTAVNCMLARNLNPQARIIAELLDPGQRLYLETAGANEVVGIGEVGGFLLTEATIGNDVARKLLGFVANVGRSLQK